MKFNSIQSTFLRKFLQLPKNTSLLNTFSRLWVVMPDMVGLRLKVHNGKEFELVTILENMVGYKLGEFVGTRVRYEFKKKKKKKK